MRLCTLVASLLVSSAAAATTVVQAWHELDRKTAAESGFVWTVTMASPSCGGKPRVVLFLPNELERREPRYVSVVSRDGSGGFDEQVQLSLESHHDGTSASGCGVPFESQKVLLLASYGFGEFVTDIYETGPIYGGSE